MINHRCATGQGAQGAWNVWTGVKASWDESAICSNNPQFAGRGGRKEGDDFTAAPNIDHSQAFVRRDLADWLAWLRRDVGFDSLRFDFTKGYDGRWVGEYVDAAAPEFAVGEFWDTMSYSGGSLDYSQDSHRQRTVDWIDRARGRAAAFDFTTKGILQQAAAHGEWWRLVDKAGRPPGLLGLWPSRAVTFIDNHDTGSTQAHWPFPANKVVLGYAYILTHPGMPCVLWDHVFDWGDDVKRRILELVAVRAKAGIVSRAVRGARGGGRGLPARPDWRGASFFSPLEQVSRLPSPFSPPRLPPLSRCASSRPRPSCTPRRWATSCA